MKRFGLRVDVCHLTALTEGVPPLLDLFRRTNVRATFFVALGPDNAGRGGLRRIFQPGFLRKMWRSRAWKMYGWKTITAGWFGAPNVIADAGAAVLRALAESPHEIGLHGWDHAAWQDRMEQWSVGDVAEHLRNASDAYERIFGRKPLSSAAPGWRISPRLLRANDLHEFAYASDSRGECAFRPAVDGTALTTIQIPLTLPTLDEWMALGQSAPSFFSEMISRIDQAPFAVLAVHAEAEGRLYLRDFAGFLETAASRGLVPVPLGDVARDLGRVEPHAVSMGELPGRAQRVLIQEQRQS